ncbi:hypothetical protein LJC48_01805 [Desulfovibrio sp. OttesenSCG-928-C06]|nr:hypothetical protein [Desulfovibrio sp. OttesenSCG-928-C06]
MKLEKGEKINTICRIRAGTDSVAQTSARMELSANPPMARKAAMLLSFCRMKRIIAHPARKK